MYDCGNRFTREACPVFPGIELVYRDGTAGGSAEEVTGYGSGGLMGICHCREGRMEWEDRDGFCYVEQGDLLIARLGGDFRDCRFPTGRYRGISVLLDVDRAPWCLSCYLEDVAVLFTTHISEDDVIMGEVSRLENAILEVDQAYHLRIIFVVAAAVIAVIGTDIAGVCQYMQEQVFARLISFEEGGFRQALEELDIRVEHMLCSHSLKAVENPDPQVSFMEKEKDRIQMFHKLQGQWCLGSDEMERSMGEKGMDYLTELDSIFRTKI